MLLGLGSQLVAAWAFGAGLDMDSYLTAQVIPTYAQAVLLGGLAFVLIPLFVSQQSEGREADAWALVGTVFYLVAAILIGLSLVGAIAAHSIIAITAPGLSPEKAELSASMLRILMFTLPFVGVAGVASSIENSLGRFFLPAFAPGVGALVNMAVVGLGYRQLGVVVLAWGAVSASILQATIVVRPVWRHGWTRLLPLGDDRLRRFGRLVAPLVIFGLLTRVTPVLERYFASDLPDGELSFLGYASKIAGIVLAILGAGIAAAILPQMARNYALRKRDGLAQTTVLGLRLTLVVSLPVLVILSLSKVPLVQVLFERGAFTPVTSQAVSRAVPLFLGVVVFQMVCNVLTRAIYVEGDTITVPVLASAASLLYLLVASLLMQGNAGYVGLAAAQVIQWGVLTSVLAVVLSRRHIVPIKTLLGLMGKYGLPAIISGVITYWLIGELDTASPLVVLVVSTLAGFLAYILLIGVLDRPMLLHLLDAVNMRKHALSGPRRPDSG